jgi:hypothetical protein
MLQITRSRSDGQDEKGGERLTVARVSAIGGEVRHGELPATMFW